MTIAPGDSVTVEFTGRLDDGTVFDTTRETVANDTELADAQSERTYTPMTIEIGGSRVIDGLESALIGLERGDTPTVTIPPEKGYGEWTPDHVREYETEEFSQLVGGQTPEEGTYLETQDGGLAEIVHIGDEGVRVDFNHALAGETLEFDIEIVDVN